MVDFSNCLKRSKPFDGANGKKFAVMYNGAWYMIKQPQIAKKNIDMHYTISCVSEYIGCHIFEQVDVPVQETILGTYKGNACVACKDFESKEWKIKSFAALKNTVIDSSENGFGTELEDMLYSIDNQMLLDPVEVNQRFWDMFIVDALIGNWDRHNGNWGLLYNEELDSAVLAPVFDCASSLYPQADDTIMQMVLENQGERNTRIYNIPVSKITINGTRINYFDFISSLKNKECNEALKRIVPRLDMSKINILIDNIEYISDLQKTFYKTMLNERKQIILDKPLEKLLESEKGEKHDSIKKR
ncbi:MAG: HipA domain-containing protein [Eubacteriales bacterium]|nr:HipA domain-containing protein [Eubacteriales bacterium]